MKRKSPIIYMSLIFILAMASGCTSKRDDSPKSYPLNEVKNENIDPNGGTEEKVSTNEDESEVYEGETETVKSKGLHSSGTDSVSSKGVHTANENAVSGKAIYTHSVSNPTFGFEFTFTNKDIKTACKKEVNGSLRRSELNVGCQAVRRSLEALRKEFAQFCSENESDPCSITTKLEQRYVKVGPGIKFNGKTALGYDWKHTVEWKNPDFKIVLATDPKVIEVTGSPQTLEEAKSASSVHRVGMLFSLARKMKLIPAVKSGVGGGHIHIGFHTFDEKPLDALKFFTLLKANSDFFMSGFRACNDTEDGELKINRNLPGRTDESLKVLHEILSDCRTCSHDSDQIHCVRKCFSRINDEYYRGSDQKDPEYSFADPHGYDGLAKFRAFNVTKIANDSVPEENRTLEIRAAGPQRSYSQWLAQIELISYLVDEAKQSHDFAEVKDFQPGKTCAEAVTHSAQAAKRFVEHFGEHSAPVIRESLVKDVREHFDSLMTR